MGTVSWRLCEVGESCSLCKSHTKLVKLSISILISQKGKQKVRELQTHAQRQKAGKSRLGWSSYVHPSLSFSTKMFSYK